LCGVRLLLEKSKGGFTPQGCIYFRCADIALAVNELSKRGVSFEHKPRLIASRRNLTDAQAAAPSR
jgi:hypothetical protein